MAKQTILVAEDSPPNRTILIHLLKKLDFNVIEAEDGQTAWDQLQKNQNIDAVLSDLMMPRMDGLAFLKLVRESAQFKELPFLLITAVSDKEYIVQAKTLEVSGYILKPVTYQRVSAKLKELFPNKDFPKLTG